jgi:hypothetical protein
MKKPSSCRHEPDFPGYETVMFVGGENDLVCHSGLGRCKKECPHNISECLEFETKITMTKYFKRGTREYYQVTPERVIRLLNKEKVSYITIAVPGDLISTMEMIASEAECGTEISRDEFKEQFLVASRLIVLEP